MVIIVITVIIVIIVITVIIAIKAIIAQNNSSDIKKPGSAGPSSPYSSAPSAPAPSAEPPPSAGGPSASCGAEPPMTVLDVGRFSPNEQQMTRCEGQLWSPPRLQKVMSRSKTPSPRESLRPTPET